MTSTRFGVGDYFAGEGYLMHRGRLSQPASDRLLVVCHGRTPTSANGCLQFSQNALGGPPHLLYLAERGYAVMVVDAGGNLTWGNDTSVAAVHSAIAWARAQGQCHPTAKVGLVGYSMGNVVAMNYMRQHSGVAAAYIGEAAPYDLDTFHSDATYTAEVDAAYPSGYAASNPATFAGQITVPTRLFHAVDDPTVPITQGRSLLAALGSTDKALTELQGGGHANFWQYMDAPSLLAWLNGLSWA